MESHGIQIADAPKQKPKNKSQREKVENNMEVKMNKEIRDYQESMFWGLSFRQCLFSVLAILAALGSISSPGNMPGNR